MWNFFVARRSVAGLLIAVGAGGDMIDAGGGMGVLVIQLVKRYQILEIVVSCSC